MKKTDQLYATTGSLIRREREQANLTQEELAKKVGLTRASITNIESGRQKMLLHTFYELAGALNVSPSSLLPRSVSKSEMSCEICKINYNNFYNLEEEGFLKKYSFKVGRNAGKKVFTVCPNCYQVLQTHPDLAVNEIRKMAKRYSKKKPFWEDK